MVVVMRGSTAEPHLRWDLLDHPADSSETTTGDLAVGIAHLIAGAVMNIAGPLFWAAIYWASWPTCSASVCSGDQH